MTKPKRKKTYRRWPVEEIADIRANATMPIEALAKRYGVTSSKIRNVGKRYDIAFAVAPRRAFTKEERQFMIAHPDSTHGEIATALNRSAHSVKFWRLRFKKRFSSIRPHKLSSAA